MKRDSLGWWLAASNVIIVLLVAAGLSWFATGMLRGLADSQQKLHVQLAGANAREEITRMAEDTLTYARVLADRPPLRRLISEPGREGLTPFLRRFCETSELDACAVLDGATVVASTVPVVSVSLARTLIARGWFFSVMVLSSAAVGGVCSVIPKVPLT